MNDEIRAVKNPYARKNGKIITIFDLNENERGRACGAVCPQCNDSFEARMGEKRIWHFAHTGECCDIERVIINSTYEMVKSAIEERGYIVTPALYIKYSNYGYKRDTMSYQLLKNEMYGYDKLIDISKYHVDSVEGIINKNGVFETLILYTKYGKVAVRLEIQTDYCNERVGKKYDNFATLVIRVDQNFLCKTSVELYSMYVDVIENKHWVYLPMIEKYMEKKLSETISIHNQQVEYRRKCKEEAEKKKKELEEQEAVRIAKEEEEKQKKTEADAKKRAQEKDIANNTFFNNHPITRQLFDKINNASQIKMIMFSHQSDNTEKRRKVDDTIKSVNIIPEKNQIVIKTLDKDLFLCIKELHSDKIKKMMSGALYLLIDITGRADLTDVLNFYDIDLL